MIRRIAAVGALVAMIAGASFAETMKFNNTGYGRNVQISLNSGSTYNSVFGGVLNMTYTGSTGSIVLDGFCADPTVSMSGSNFGVSKTDSSIKGSKGLFAGYLVNKYAPAIFTGGNTTANRDKASALQVALWEVLTETSSTLSVTSGAFRARNSDGSAFTTAQKNLINGFLSDFGQSAATYYKAALNQYGKPVSQSIITPVPEPMSIAALALGVGAFVRRRRSSK